MKESVVAGMSSSSALAENLAGLNNAVVCSRVDEQVASVETPNVQLEGQTSELDMLKESLLLNNVAIYANNQSVVSVK